MGRYVVALGGNALSAKALKSAGRAIARLYASGSEVVVTHGNGPQVGELAASSSLNLSLLTAQTQAWIGSVIEDGIASQLRRLGRRRSYDLVEVVLTRVAVSPHAAAFSNPTKPIGRFYTKAQADRERSRGITVKKLAGGYRRVVPSPPPRRILEADEIAALLASRKIAIACGGGGIAVAVERGRQRYVNAVIDKDRTSALLAAQIHADALFILTNVDGVYRDYGKPEHRLIERMSAGQASAMLKSLEKGSMGPKVESCIRFVRATGKIAGIGNIANPQKVFSLRRLTLITP